MKKIITLVTLCIFILTFTACNKNEQKKQTKRYSIGTSTIGGTFYLLGGGVSTLINKHLPNDFLFTTESTGGSTANIGMLQSGEIELGIAMTSTLSDGYNGTAAWTRGVKHDKIRGVIALYPSSLTIYCLAEKPIHKLSDLNGKIVGLGSKGSAMDTSMRAVLDMLGIKPKSIHNDGHSATASAVADGVIDAAITFQSAPYPAISEIEGTKDLRFIPLTSQEQDKIIELYSFYSKTQMPGGIYKGAKDPVNTLEEWNMLVSSSDISADEIYLITKAIYENQPELLAIHRASANIIPQNDLHFNIPLHAGTIKYLKEIGVELPEELIPEEFKH